MKVRFCGVSVMEIGEAQQMQIVISIPFRICPNILQFIQYLPKYLTIGPIFAQLSSNRSTNLHNFIKYWNFPLIDKIFCYLILVTQRHDSYHHQLGKITF